MIPVRKRAVLLFVLCCAATGASADAFSYGMLLFLSPLAWWITIVPVVFEFALLVRYFEGHRLRAVLAVFLANFASTLVGVVIVVPLTFYLDAEYPRLGWALTQEPWPGWEQSWVDVVLLVGFFPVAALVSTVVEAPILRRLGAAGARGGLGIFRIYAVNIASQLAMLLMLVVVNG